MTAAEVGIGEGVPVSDERLAAALRAGDPRAIAEAFDRYADHLDPQDTHLDPKPTNLQSSGSVGCGFSSLGTKLGWSDAGEGGLGVVQIEVSRGPRNGQIRLYHQDWRTTRVHLPGVEEARVAEHGDGIAVIVSRTDGLSVAIDADSLSATTPPRRSPVSGSLPRFSYEEIIGDGLYKLPFVRMVRAAYPSARITWITTRKTVYAGRLQPLMDGLIDEFRQDSGIGAGVAGLLKPLPFRERFGVIIDTQTTLWRTLTIRRMPHDLFVSGALGFRLSDAKPPPSQIRPPHMVDRLADLLRLAAGSVPKVEAGLRLPEPLVAKAEAALPTGPRYVGLAPGAGKRFKCWPLDRFVAVARAQVERGRVPVFILGPDELEWLPGLREAVPEALFPEQDRQVWGDEFTPLRTIALARRFAAAVANDSGVSHMFGAADIPLVTLFGPTPATKFQPKVTSGGAVTAQEFGGRDMTAIPAQAVIERLDRLAIHPIDHGSYSKKS